MLNQKIQLLIRYDAKKMMERANIRNDAIQGTT